jgi:hypothetical protein
MVTLSKCINISISMIKIDLNGYYNAIATIKHNIGNL